MLQNQVKPFLSETRIRWRHHRGMAPRYPYTDELRRKIIYELAARDLPNKALMKPGGVSEGMISQLLSEEKMPSRSEAIPGICKFLGIDFAMYVTEDPAEQRVFRALQHVRDHAPERAEGFVQLVEADAERMSGAPLAPPPAPPPRAAIPVPPDR